MTVKYTKKLYSASFQNIAKIWIFGVQIYHHLATLMPATNGNHEIYMYTKLYRAVFETKRERGEKVFFYFNGKFFYFNGNSESKCIEIKDNGLEWQPPSLGCCHSPLLAVCRSNLRPILNIFAKKSAKNLAFLTQNKAKLCKNLCVTLAFEKNANFFAKNWRKSQKIVIMTSTPGRVIYTDNVHR
jgi:hypothetical protein